MTREIGFTRLWGVVRRRRWTVAITASLAAVLGLLYVWHLPKLYQARAAVRIDDPRPARDYVAPTVTEPGIERLKSVRRALIARPIVLAAGQRAGMSELQAEGASLRLDARQEGEDTWFLTYEDTDPARAERFLAALTEAYTLSRAAELQHRAAATETFFAGEIDRLRPLVAASEVGVEAFRMAHYGALPDQMSANLAALDAIGFQINTLSLSVDSALQRRRAILADASWPLRRQEEEAARALSVGRTRFAAGAPEIAALEQELARVRAERSAEEEALASPSSEGKSGNTRATSELRGVDQEIARLRGTVDALLTRKDELSKRIEDAAKNGEALAKLSLDRDVMRKELESMLAKHQEATVAAGLEADVAGRARVAVIEPAWTGRAPVKPPKLFYALVALLLAGGLGLGVGFLADTATRTVRRPEDVATVTDVPVLGSIPRITVLKGHKP
jgi:polysaccharide biosynthesis transport protein